MDLRPAATTDHEGIRRVADASLDASYSHVIDDETRTAAVEYWYDDQTVADRLTAADSLMVVAVDNGEIIGVVQSELVDGYDLTGVIDWLHVDPDHRGMGVGGDLLARVEAELRDRDVDAIEGRVLAANTVGADFYERHGFTLADKRHVEIGDRTFTELRYRKRYRDNRDVLTGELSTDDGTIYVAYNESDRGSQGPFYVAYLDPERTDRYGYVCGACSSSKVAMDAMGRVECSDCDNARKPSRWDAAYL